MRQFICPARPSFLVLARKASWLSASTNYAAGGGGAAAAVVVSVVVLALLQWVFACAVIGAGCGGYGLNSDGDHAKRR